MPSFYKKKAYIFLQLKAVGLPVSDDVYRERRKEILQIACGSAKNKFPHLETIIGIAIDAPKYSEYSSENFLYMDCTKWDEQDSEDYKILNKDFCFFETSALSMQYKKITEFPQSSSKSKTNKFKIGRNSPCPCGSGKKFKKCCIDIYSR